MPSSLGMNANLMLVLLNVPFFGVGLTAIAMFVFVLFLKHTTFLFVYLYSASLFAFAAAILDLSDILVVGVQASSIQSHDLPNTPLSTAGEIFLSLSLGFLFLFLWLAVAQCPQQEHRMQINSATSDHSLAHCASWQRWGYLGMMLQWSTLAACISIPLLQMIWRVLKAQHLYGNVYIAESTIQTVLSFIFILKLFLNVSLSRTPWWKALWSYSIPLVSLAISTALGVMNVVQFAFSETITGRFLRATEIYLLIIHSLVASFLQPAYPPSQVTSSEAQPSFVVSSEKPFDNRVITPETSGAATKSDFSEIIQVLQPQDSFNSVQTRNIPRRYSQRPKLVGTGWESGRDSPLASSKPEVVGNLFEQDVRSSITSRGLSSDPSITKEDDSEPAIGYSSVYGPTLTSRVSVDHKSLASIYSSPSITGGNGDNYSADRATSSIDSFDKLLLQQRDLDNSIAALRILSPPQSPSRRKSPLNLNNDINKQESDQQGRESTSGRSDFSLSHFPRPPVILDNEYRLSELSLATTEQRNRNSIQQTIQDGNGPPEMSKYQHGSATTQYDVTSFIGDFYGAGNEGSLSPIGEPEQGTEMQLHPDLKPMFLSAIAPQIPPPISPELESSPVPDLSRNIRRSPLHRDSNALPLRPLLLGTSMPLHLVPTSNTLVPIGSRRNRQGSNASRPLISLPRPLAQPDGSDVKSAYERPRPPPLKP